MIKKIFLFILLLLLTFPIIQALPPNLPFILNGKVMTEDKTPIGNMAVTASWNTSQGIRSVSTLTIDKSKAIEKGSEEFFGEYIFEQGVIDVPVGTKVTVSSGGSSVDIITGNTRIIKAPTLIVFPKDFIEPNSGKGNGIFNFFKNIVKDIFSFFPKSTSIDTASRNSSNNTGSSVISDQIKSTDTNSSVSTINSENKNTNSSGRNKANTNNSGNSSIDYDPSSQVYQDYSGSDTKPRGNENASSKGVSDDSNINETIPINSATYNSSHSKNNFSEVQEPIHENTNLYEAVLNYPVLKDNPYRLWIVGIILFIVLSLIFLLILFFVNLYRRFLKEEHPLKNSISNLDAIRSKSFMNKSYDSIYAESTVEDALDIFIDNNINLIPVLTANSVKGILTKRDLLSNFVKEGYDLDYKVKVSKIMKKDYRSCDINTEMKDIYFLMVQKGFKEIIVEKDSDFVGVVDFFSMLKVFDKANFIIENPPTLNQALDKDVFSVDHKTNLAKLSEELIKKKKDYAIIEKDGKPVGIVTIKDLIIAIKNKQDFKKIRVENIMSSNMVKMTPGTSIYEAMRIAIDRRFNQIPVMMDGKVYGIVHVEYLVKVYYDMLSELKERLSKRFRKNAAELVKEDE